MAVYFKSRQKLFFTHKKNVKKSQLFYFTIDNKKQKGVYCNHKGKRESPKGEMTMEMSYSEFYNRKEELNGCSYRIIGEMSGKIVKSCWRKNTQDLAENPNGKLLKILGVEVR